MNTPTAERRRYKNPPIEEALCEFRFESKPGREWDPTIPGRFHAEFDDSAYAGKPQEQKFFEVGMEQKEGAPPRVRLEEKSPKIQLVTEDGKRIVGIGPDVLSIHMLRPYQHAEHPEASGWDEFRARIDTAIEAYWKVMQPVGVRRVAVRYINKIAIPAGNAGIENYLSCLPPLIDGLPEQRIRFMSQAEYTYPDAVRLVLSQSSVDTPDNAIGLLLDLDIVWENAEPVPMEEAMQKVDDLRQRERSAFEAVVTDKAREMFDVA